MRKILHIDVRGVDTMQAALFFFPRIDVLLRIYVHAQMRASLDRTSYVEATKAKVNQHNSTL